MKNFRKYLIAGTLMVSSEAQSSMNDFDINTKYAVIDQKAVVDDILDMNVNQILNRSVYFVGKIEVDNFVDFFGLAKKDANLFIKRVTEIQREYGLKEDGILGPETLREVYLNFYMMDGIQNLPLEIKKRIKIYRDMEGYNDIEGALNGNLNVFSKKIFYGIDMGINIAGTYINQDLLGAFPDTLDDNKNLIIFNNIGGKTALAFYVKGKLELATYGSPGLDDGKHDTSRLITKGTRYPDKLHYSTEYPEAQITDYDFQAKGGAVMPFAVHAFNSVRMHGSDSTIDGYPHSHGCIRIPLYYIEHIYELVKKLGIKNIVIDTRNIY